MATSSAISTRESRSESTTASKYLLTAYCGRIRTKEHNFKPFQKDIPIALELPGSEDHVWVGKTLTSKLLYEKENEAKTAKIGVYCVDCGIKGELKFDSVLTFVPLDLIAGKGLRAGQL